MCVSSPNQHPLTPGLGIMDRTSGVIKSNAAPTINAGAVPPAPPAMNTPTTAPAINPNTAFPGMPYNPMSILQMFMGPGGMMQ